MNTERILLVCAGILLLLPALPHQAHADDCTTYTAPLSLPITTEAQYAASVVAGNQTRLAYLLDVVVAPYRYDDVVELLERIETTLLPHFPQGVREYNYEYFVFDRAIEKNLASAAEGGPIRVSEELLLDSESADVLAFVMAHEMGHVVSQHTARYLQDVDAKANDYWARLKQDVHVTDPVLKEVHDNERRAVLMQGSVNSETLMQPHEIEADVFAAHIATQAGYNPEIMARFFDQMAEEHGNEPASLTHPADEDRAALLRCFSNLSSGPSHEDLDAQFHAVQDRLFELRRTVENSTQSK